MIVPLLLSAGYHVRIDLREQSAGHADVAISPALGPDARRPHYQRAQQVLAEQLPVIPLWHADVVFALRRPYRGLRPRGDGQLDFLLRLTR